MRMPAEFKPVSGTWKCSIKAKCHQVGARLNLCLQYWYPYGCPLELQLLSFQSSIHASAQGKQQQNMIQVHGPLTPRGRPGKTPGYWLWISPALTIASGLGSESLGGRCLPLSLSLSATLPFN